MMWKEFEELAGYEVSYETYSKVIEPMYMALPENVTKQQFVGMLNKKAFALPTKREMFKEMKKLAEHLLAVRGHYTDYETEEKLYRLAKEYAKRFYGIDWSNDLDSWVYFNREYEYEGYRGCSCPSELVIGKGHADIARIALLPAAL